MATQRHRMDVHEFEVLGNEAVAQDIWRLSCKTSVAASLEPGQFVNICVPGDASHVLRVPLSFSMADGSSNALEIVYAVVGEGTQRLSMMRPSQSSTLVGPCGKGWALPKRHGRSLLVAGGVGLPPIVACARMLAQSDLPYDVIVGAQTAEKHIDYLLDQIAGLGGGTQLIVTTDDGTRGMRGFTTTAMADLLAEHAYEQVYTCGPHPMMAGVARLSGLRGISCQASLERMMGCGFGACSCCNVELKAGGYALCCQDGPVFDANEVAW